MIIFHVFKAIEGSITMFICYGLLLGCFDLYLALPLGFVVILSLSYMQCELCCGILLVELGLFFRCWCGELIDSISLHDGPGCDCLCLLIGSSTGSLLRSMSLLVLYLWYRPCKHVELFCFFIYAACLYVLCEK